LIGVGSVAGPLGVAIGLCLGQALQWAAGLITFARRADCPRAKIASISFRALLLCGLAAGAAVATTNSGITQGAWLSGLMGLAAYSLTALSLGWLPLFRQDLLGIRRVRKHLKRESFKTDDGESDSRSRSNMHESPKTSMN
jgi:hypothetical protein